MRSLGRILALPLVLLAGCSSGPALRPEAPAAPPAAVASVAPPPSDQLDALAWYQTAEEAHRLSQAVYAAATTALDAALADPGWSALGQGAEAASLPPAVIVDVDETVLDNSPIQARFLADGTRFTPATFKAWVEAAEAVALPGAREFARAAAARGATLFYVTNRDAGEETATRRNLAREGFVLQDGVDVVLTRGERPEWGSDKESRRQEIARSYRVLLLIGDDLTDFLAGSREATLERRRELAEGASANWGRSWFLLANPIYGSWERSLIGGQPGSMPPEEVRKRKREALRAFDGPLPPP